MVAKKELLNYSVSEIVPDSSPVKGMFLAGAKVEIACLYIKFCFPSDSNKMVKLSYDLTNPFNWNPFVKNTVTKMLFFRK